VTAKSKRLPTQDAHDEKVMTGFGIGIMKKQTGLGIGIINGIMKKTVLLSKCFGSLHINTCTKIAS